MLSTLIEGNVTSSFLHCLPPSPHLTGQMDVHNVGRVQPVEDEHTKRFVAMETNCLLKKSFSNLCGWCGNETY